MKLEIALKRQVWLVAAMMLAGATMGPVAAASEKQIRFSVLEPFRVGSHVYDAGVIAMRSVSAYTPTTTLFKVWVNDECLGMIAAHRSVSEEPPQQTEALFHRDTDGRLQMVGFRVTGRPTGTTYRFPDATNAAALRIAQTDLPSTISPETARRAASASESDSTVSTSSAWRLERVASRSSAK
jgi:hypothetical protein